MQKNSKSGKSSSTHAHMSEVELREYTEKFRVKKGEPHTHTSKDPGISYYIGDKEDDFLTMYCNLIRKGAIPSFTEKPGIYGPMRIDFDMKATLECGLTRMYSHSQHIIPIVKWCQEIIRNSIDASDDGGNYDESEIERMLICVVLEKSKPRTDCGVVKDGFHLHFPHFICEGWFQDEYVRAILTEKMLSTKLWEPQGAAPNGGYSNQVEDFIDKNIAVKNWLMYGSAKLERAEPYLYTIAYDHNLNEISIAKVFEEEMVARKNSVKYYLPRFMSVRGYNRATVLKKEVENKRKFKRTTRKRGPILNKKRSTQEILEDIKTITDGNIMEMISPDRADDHDQWMDVGWILYNIGEGCDEALSLWIDFSKKSIKFTPGECEDRWGKMEIKGKTIGSLFAIAKNDSPEEYREWKKQQINYHLYKSLVEDKPNEWDVSVVMKELYKDRFVCANSKNDIWFEFKNHKWVQMDDALSIKKLFCSDVRELFYALKEDIVKRQRLAQNDENERIKLEKMEKRCMAMTSALKTVTFIEKTMKMCKIQFHDPLFLKLIDENKLLFGCENGVLDLGTRLFREGRPDDYVTLSCGITYNANYTYEDEDIEAVFDFLKKIFPNPNLRNYFLDSICACLEGGNTNKIFVIHTGEPDGGKSLTMSFVENTFGEYCIKFPRELFIVSGKNSSGGARPELARVRGKRIGMGQEVAKTETFNIGVIKELTGNDSFFARTLHEKGSDIKPMFTLMMQCNEPPKVPGHDEATWARTRLLPYESKFVKARELEKYPVPETEEERIAMKRWKADPELAGKLAELHSAFLWILFTRFDEYKKRGGIRDPPEVQMATSSYRQMNDVFLQFIKDRIVAADASSGENAFLKLSDLASEFQDWFQENNTSYAREKFTKVALGHEFSKRFGALTKQGGASGWIGYKIAAEEVTDEKAKVEEVLKNKK